MSAHYDYIVNKTNAVAPVNNPACLDFGCWKGSLMTYMRDKGFDVIGLDLEELMTENYQSEVANTGLEFGKDIILYDGKTIPFEDNHFDVVIANMVFEHVQDHSGCLQEIHRVLKPGGALLALFPTAEALWEDHVRLYFVHKMGGFKALQYQYIALMHKLGFGKKSGRNQDTKVYTEATQKFLQDHCFYHSSKEIFSTWQDAFGQSPQTDEVGYMKSRLGSHPFFKRFVKISEFPVMRSFLKFISIVRATRVFVVVKNTELQTA